MQQLDVLLMHLKDNPILVVTDRGEWMLTLNKKNKLHIYHRRKGSHPFHDQKQYRKFNPDGLQKIFKYIRNHDFDYLGGDEKSFTVKAI